MGISIMQATQLITILGGGAGYMLAANSYIAEIVEPVERTAAFGVLAGMTMLGSALGACRPNNLSHQVLSSFTLYYLIAL